MLPKVLILAAVLGQLNGQVSNIGSAQFNPASKPGLNNMDLSLFDDDDIFNPNFQNEIHTTLNPLPSRKKVNRQQSVQGNSADKFSNGVRVSPNPAPRQSSNQPCGNGGFCVPYYLCNDNNNTLNYESLIENRIGITECADALSKCCGETNITSTPLPLSVVNIKPGCGHRNANGVGGIRITGGTKGESEFGEIPWMVMILEKNNETMNFYLCGGSLIHPSVVLTAAHCVRKYSPSDLKVRAGEWDSQTLNEYYAHEDRFVRSIKINEHFHDRILHNDVALLFLDGPQLVLTPTINTICLPPQDHSFDNQHCFASGWGKNIYNQVGLYQKIMKKVELPMVAHDTCQTNLQATRLTPLFRLHISFVCAGGEKDKDVCKGDGGGPLACPIIRGSQDRYYQSGIVAWGVGCGNENVPGVYAKVSHFRNWIDQQFDAENLDKKFYIP